MGDHQVRRVLFLQAVRFAHERGGEDAVLQAFGDADLVNAKWELPLSELKGFLRGRIRVALAGRAA